MELISPEHNKYKKILQKNPRSKVFAFLANIYRKYAMMDEALEILERGIHYNPEYIPGYLILAQCYYDQRRYEVCYSKLKPLVSTNGDNFKLLSIFAQVCEELELWEEALDAYKQLQYLNPKNQAWIDRVEFLKRKLEDDTTVQNQKFFREESLSNFPNDIDEWTELNFVNDEQKDTTKININAQNNLMDIYDKKFGFSDSKKNKLVSVRKQLQNFYGAINKRANAFLTR